MDLLHSETDYASLVRELTDPPPKPWQAWRGQAGPWTCLARSGTQLPRQGWKLHISVGAKTAAEVMDRVLRTLLQMDCWFKFAPSIDQIIRLNSGAAGPTQIGKIVTVYPASDAVLAAMVASLSADLPLTHPPAVPSDLSVDPGRGLWMRYGAFDGQLISDAHGRLSPALLAPDGTLVADRKATNGKQIDWAPPPPIALATRPPADEARMLEFSGRSYLRMKTIQRKAGTLTALGLSVPDGETVIIKSATAGEGADAFGEDAVDRLAQEHSVLAGVAAAGLSPRVLSYDAPRAILVEQDLGGEVLSVMPPGDAIGLLPDVADVVARLHQLGYAHRDIKLANIVATNVGIRLIDFECAAPLGSDASRKQLGTPGYMAPEAGSAPVAAAQDVFAIGGAISHACLGVCAGYLPASPNAERQVRLLELSGQAAAARLVRAACQPDPQRRPPASALGAVARAELTTLKSEFARSWQTGPKLDRDWALEAALRGGRATRDFQVSVPGGHAYRNNHFHAAYLCEPLNIGAAGIVLGLMSIEAAAGSDAFAADVLGACNWLARRPPDPNAHGLFTGNAGVALALAVAGRRYGNEEFIVAARRRMEVALAGCHEENDLFTGSAGVVWTATVLADILEAEWPLEGARRHAQDLMNSAVVSKADHVQWPSSSSYDASRTPYFGAAHGAAGIALGLAAWGDAGGETRSTRLALDTFAGLFATGNAARSKGAAPSGKARPLTRWCHGVAGYLWSMQQSFPGHPGLAEARAWAIELLGGSPFPLGDMTYCHGLSSIVETWRVVDGAGPASDLAALRVRQGAEIMRTLAQERGDNLVWGSEDPRTITPDLWVGFLGPSVNLAMAAIGSVDAMMSRPWLLRCAKPASH